LQQRLEPGARCDRLAFADVQVCQACRGLKEPRLLGQRAFEALARGRSVTPLKGYIASQQVGQGQLGPAWLAR